MKQTATVVEHEGRLMAEIVRSEACQSCRACRFGQEERVYVDVGSLECKAGDQVVLEMDDRSFSKASVMAYGVPVALFIAMLFASRTLTSNEYFQTLLALVGLGLGLICVRIIDKYIKESGRYAPRVTISRGNGEEHG